MRGQYSSLTQHAASAFPRTAPTSRRGTPSRRPSCFSLSWLVWSEPSLRPWAPWLARRRRDGRTGEGAAQRGPFSPLLCPGAQVRAGAAGSTWRRLTTVRPPAPMTAISATAPPAPIIASPQSNPLPESTVATVGVTSATNDTAFDPSRRRVVVSPLLAAVGAAGTVAAVTPPGSVRPAAPAGIAIAAALSPTASAVISL